MNIRQELLKGTKWNAAGRYSRYAFQFIVLAILARLLKPSDFGIISMVVIYTGFVDLLSEFGLSATIVQKRYLNHKELSTVFWLSILIALTSMGGLIFLSPMLDKFFNFPGLRVVTQAMSVNLLLSGAAVVYQGRFQQRMAFKELAIIEVLATILSGFLGVVLALLGKGYWALVVQSISYRMFILIGLSCCDRWLPLLTIQFHVIRDVVSFSGYVLGFRSVNYWARNADNLLIGKLLGPAQLGFYNQAYKLMMLPIQLITNTISPTLQPVFARIQDEPRKMASPYLEIIELIALITIPLGVFLSLFAGPIVRMLWGAQWEASAPVFKVLAILTMVQPIISTSGSIFLARNQAKLLFKLGFANSLIMVAGITAGLPFGTVGVAMGYAIAYVFLVFPITMYFLAKTLHEKLGKMFAALVKPILMSLFMAPIMMQYKSMIFPLSDFWMLVGAVGIAIIVLLGGMYIFYRAWFINIAKMLRLPKK